MQIYHIFTPKGLNLQKTNSTTCRFWFTYIYVCVCVMCVCCVFVCMCVGACVCLCFRVCACLCVCVCVCVCMCACMCECACMCVRVCVCKSQQLSSLATLWWGYHILRFLLITPLENDIFKNGFCSQSAFFKAHLLIYITIRSRSILFAHFRNFGDF